MTERGAISDARQEGLAEGLAEGMEKGLERGKVEEKLEIAKNAKTLGLSIEQIRHRSQIYLQKK
jgi:predicted transposase YdaD